MTTTFTIRFEDASVPLEARTVSGVERVGEPSRHEVELFSRSPVEPASVVGKGCAITLANELGERFVAGIVTRFVRIATSHAGSERRYRAVVESGWAILRYGRRSRVHQHITVPDLVKKVLTDAGYPASQIDCRLGEPHAEREYVVQWLESDLSFIRRLCEEEGLFFFSEVTDAGEKFVLADTSSSADAFPDPVIVTDGGGLAQNALVAWQARVMTQRLPGKVTLRDHNPAKPAAVLTGSASGGVAIEKETEVYLAPGRFTSPSEGEARAKTKLSILRALSKRISFETSALALAPGHLVTLEHGDDFAGTPAVEGEYFVISVELAGGPEPGESTTGGGPRPRHRGGHSQGHALSPARGHSPTTDRRRAGSARDGPAWSRDSSGRRGAGVRALLLGSVRAGRRQEQPPRAGGAAERSRIDGAPARRVGGGSGVRGRRPGQALCARAGVQLQVSAARGFAGEQDNDHAADLQLAGRRDEQHCLVRRRGGEAEFRPLRRVRQVHAGRQPHDGTDGQGGKTGHRREPDSDGGSQ